VLAGSSLGANIAIRFAIEEPDRVRRVVLLSPFGMAAQLDAVERLDRLDPLLPLVSLFVSRAFLARELEHLVQDPDALTPSILDSYHRPFRAAAGRRVVVEVTRRILCGCTFDDRLPLVRQPVLVIAGTEDVFGAAEVLDDIAARLPSCSPVRLDGGRHAIQLDATAEVARIIRRFCEPGGS
jgi:pimeloyl-ACP methyl ester carboxylesterase